MDPLQEQSYKLKLTVRNRPGVLVRCAQVLGRRGHNIDTLHVTAIPSKPGISEMVITATGKANSMDQITGQLLKLIDVISVT